MSAVRRINGIVSAVGLAGVLGCQDASAPPYEPPPKPPVADVRVSPAAIHLLVGTTGIVFGYPVDETGGDLGGSPTWMTSNAGVAAVLDTGREVLVEGRGPGVAAVTALSGGRESTPILVTVLPAADLEAITVGLRHTCAVSTGDVAYCWTAENEDPRQFALGHSLVSTLCPLHPACVPIPLPVNTTVGFASVVAGSGHTCGLTPSGEAYCWGDNSFEQAGSAATTETCPDPSYPVRLVPCISRPASVTGGLTFVALSAGDSHTCGLTSEGDAACWGLNSFGQLGDTQGARSATPVRVAGGLRFTRLTAGYAHSCALTSDGTAYCWGSNSHGQLGVGSADTAVHAAPAAVVGELRFVELAAGATHTCGVVATGELYCWGSNLHAEVGDGLLQQGCAVPEGYETTYCQLSPRRVPTGLRFRSVGLGKSSTCGVTVNGAVYCWGQLAYGVGGGGGCTSWCVPGGPGDFRTPTTVPAVTPFVSISNRGRLCGIGADGVAYCASRRLSRLTGTTLEPFSRVPGQP